MSRNLVWGYGITTVPSRLNTTFIRTLESLKLAGFDKPRLFIDGARNDEEYHHLGLETTCHYPNLRTYGNWITALIELYIREPNADRYAIFQDDFVTYLSLRKYLERSPYPNKGYLNLYTFPSNQGLAPKDGTTGWYLANQLGRGAVGLVFNKEAMKALLYSKDIVDRPEDSLRGHRAIDGGIVTAMKKAGFKEYVHNPSLVQHTGDVSSMGNEPHKKAISFRGESFDVMELLEMPQIPVESRPTTEEWQREKTALEEAIRHDRIRLEAAVAPIQKRHFRQLIDQYERKLRIHLDNPC